MRFVSILFGLLCMLLLITIIAAGCNLFPYVLDIDKQFFDDGDLPSSTIPPNSAPTVQQTSTPTSETTATSTASGSSTTPLPNLMVDELPSSNLSYRLPLTIRHLGDEWAILFFEMNESGEGYLLYQEIAPVIGETHKITLADGKTRQEIIIQDLKPGAEYRTVIGIKDTAGNLSQPTYYGTNWGSLRFKTLSGNEPLRVGVFGDASFGDPATKVLMQQVAKENPDFVIHTGDIVAQMYENNDPFEAYALKYYQALAPLLHSMPVYTVPGNHDYDSAARWMDSYFYYYAFPPFSDPLFHQVVLPARLQYYAIAYKGLQFMMLDSQVIFGAEAREAQKIWMAERFADTRFRYTIPVFHVPAYFSGSVHPQDQIAVRQSWHHLFTSARVPLAISGHSHHYERLVVDDITYIVTGGGSSVLYAAGEILPYSQVFARRTHFVLLEIYFDRIELAAIDKNGELFDQAVILLP